MLLHLTHWVLTTHGVVARWIELDPFPVGIGFFLAFAFGLLLASDNSITRCAHLSCLIDLLSSWYFYLGAVVSGPLLLSLPPGLAMCALCHLLLFIIADSSSSTLLSIWSPRGLSL